MISDIMDFNQFGNNLEDSSIYLKVCGTGNINILSDSYTDNLPNQIFINGINQTTITKI